MDDRIEAAGLSVGQELYSFVNNEVLPGTGISPSNFWVGFAAIMDELTPRTQQLLTKRDFFQEQIDNYWKNRQGLVFEEMVDTNAQFEHLTSINYIVPEGPDFEISTANTDSEIAEVCGPQLVVPLFNARYALNAANARWGSLYDALYGSDAIDQTGELARAKAYNPKRGEKVIAWGRQFLDDAAALQEGSHSEVSHYHVTAGKLVALKGDDGLIGLKDTTKFIGYQGNANSPTAIILRNNGLHILIKINTSHIIGQNDPAGICDIIIEAAMSTIMDCEDSVAVVDEEDKVKLYRNWLGLMRSTLEVDLNNSGKGEPKLRQLNQDIEYNDADGNPAKLKGRSLMLIRNVGHLMTTPAVLNQSGKQCPEGIMDAIITCLIALHDIKGNSSYKNSPNGSIYIVKPKMHGPDEVTLACDIFGRVEELLKLPAFTIKIGIMDEERRTTLNLRESIRAAKDRVFFINTGFLDRTGDEIHTAMQAGAIIRKNDIKDADWIAAYEDWNMDIGLACGLSGKAQIGKGMWAMPDLMADMLASKMAHLMAGANTSWVPSPTAAILHATHYHRFAVKERQKELIASGKRANLMNLLKIPVAKPNRNGEAIWSDEDILAEIENNCQGLLGYVVRWVENGVGCSKVPDINDIGLMEDRATLRISSQHLANWLLHGICSADLLESTLKRMAIVVDKQNQNDPEYHAMSLDFDRSIAYQAARRLIFEGLEQPNGYTEPLLHKMRLRVKAVRT